MNTQGDQVVGPRMLECFAYEFQELRLIEYQMIRRCHDNPGIRVDGSVDLMAHVGNTGEQCYGVPARPGYWPDSHPVSALISVP